MKIVIFGLTMSSSWGNGHATIWRGLCRALHERGHHIVFYERDVPYYAVHRDLFDLPGGELVLYSDWHETMPMAEKHLADADVGMVTSYCPDGIAATELVLSSPARLHCFYDLDTPITLKRRQANDRLPYIGPRGLQDFDLVLSYTGGKSLQELHTQLGAQRVAPLYGSVDPGIHRPVEAMDCFRADLSYLGTYAPDRQEHLRAYFIEPAQQMPKKRFLIGGAQYPPDFPWTQNIFFARHIPPGDHPAFYCSSFLTLNVTRQAMAETGYCPSGRLFEAAACGTPVISDYWEGLEEFFKPGSEIVVARSTEETMRALEMSWEERNSIAEAARERTLQEHTAERRAIELEEILQSAFNGSESVKKREEARGQGGEVDSLSSFQVRAELDKAGTLMEA